MNIISRITDWVSTPYTILLVLGDPSISRSAKLRAIIGLILIFAYVISPIDILPDFIPLSGWLDDMVVVPLGFALMRKFIPDIGITEKMYSAQTSIRKALPWIIAALVVAVILGLTWLGLLIYIIVRLITG
jgi:Protein of unknown function (DUF1232)